MKLDSIVGMFVIRNGEEGKYSTGQIARQVGHDAYLIRFDRVRCEVCDPDSIGPVFLPLELFRLSDMSDSYLDDHVPQFHFFDTGAERRAWIDWVDTRRHDANEDRATVVSIDKAKRH
jgi:hypothetical protein